MSRTRSSGPVTRILARSSVAVVVLGLTAGFSAAGTAGAQPAPGAAPALSVPGAPGLAAQFRQRITKLSTPMQRAGGPVTAFVELKATAAVDAATDQQRRGASRDAARRAARDARAATDSLASAVFGQARSRDASARELYRTGNAVPGIMVHADAATLRALASRPDVVSVKLATPVSPTNSSAVQLTKTLQAWQSTGKFGDGVKIGIIDTGTDYTHADFGGPGTTAAYQAIDPTTVDPSFFPTAKVIGGTDFAGNAYDAANTTDSTVFTPKPDPNPLDCNSHGTHVAGTAAGLGENADGSTFTGDYASLTPDALNAMKIGPGTAPKASIVSLKVFGCTGSTNLTEQALDFALDPNGDGDFGDHLDVVNLSLGSDFAAEDDPGNAFVDKLAANGVVPVIAEGNAGDLYDAGGSPGNAARSIAVASSRDGFILEDAAQVSAPAADAGAKAGQYSVAFTGYATLDSTEQAVALTDSTNTDGCSTFSAADKAAVAGKFAFLEWDDNAANRRCGSAVRADNANAAGAAGVLLTSTLNVFNGGIAGDTALPMFQFTADTANAIRSDVRAGTVSVRLAGALRTSLKTFPKNIEDTVSGFTSRGARGPVLKPDVAAPGDTIASASNGTGTGVLVDSGTSMATPHTAGIAALVRQVHPDWTVEEVKAAVMNTADGDIFSGENKTGSVFGPQRTGAGRADAQAAVTTPALAFDRDDPGVVSVSFGTVEAAGPVTRSKTVTVENKGGSAATFAAGFTASTSQPGVAYSVDQPTLTVPAGGTATLTVTMTIADPSTLLKTADPTTESTQLGVARQFVSDASGRLVLTPASGGPALRVPVYAAAKPVSSIATATSLRLTNNQGTLSLTGTGVNQGSGSQRYLSLLSALELQATSPQLPACTVGQTSGCVINGTAAGGDLRFVGAASTAPQAKAAGQAANSLLGFGVVTWGNLYNLGSNTQPFVDIDTNRDGTADFETFATKATGTDVWVAATVQLSTGTTVDAEPINGQFGDVDTNVFDTNAWVLPVAVAALGINTSAASARISYAVGVASAYSADGSGLVDSIPKTLSFDTLRPGLSVAGSGNPALAFQALPGTSLTVTRNTQSLNADGANSLLIIFHHNATGARAQTTSIR